MKFWIVQSPKGSYHIYNSIIKLAGDRKHSRKDILAEMSKPEMAYGELYY